MTLVLSVFLKGKNEGENMGKWLSSLSSEKKDFFFLSVIELFVFLCLIPLAFIGAGSWTLGWLVGALVTLLNYFLLIRFSSSILDPNNGDKTSVTFLALAASFLRYALFGGLLIIAAISTYKSEWLGGFSAFNVFAVALSYLPLPVLLLSSHFLRAKKESGGAQQ